MLPKSNEVLSGPYFALAAMYSSQQDKAKSPMEDFENTYWPVSYKSEDINFKSPVSASKYNAGEIFSSELLKNKTEKHGNPFWELVSFKNEKAEDSTSIQELNIDHLEEWISIPFGGIFASYRKQK